jgi:hemoglobin
MGGMNSPARIGPGAAVGLNEAMIATQVRTFYGRVREHPVLGPIFNDAVDDWDEHLAKLCDFWSSVLLATGRFRGSPMAAHARRPAIETAHFALWLDLFERTARDVCPPAVADLFVERSRMIGASLSLGLSVSRGEIPPLEA